MHAFINSRYKFKTTHIAGVWIPRAIHSNEIFCYNSLSWNRGENSLKVKVTVWNIMVRLGNGTANENPTWWVNLISSNLRDRQIRGGTQRVKPATCPGGLLRVGSVLLIKFPHDRSTFFSKVYSLLKWEASGRLLKEINRRRTRVVRIKTIA